MTVLPPTMLLLVCLLAATLLGVGIGACLWHLRLARRHAKALGRVRKAAERERRAFDATLAQEREMATLKHEQERRRTRKEHERAERALARHEALAAQEREQGRRIDRLESEALVLEERRSARRRDARADRGEEERPIVNRVGEERLPVLNRRVGGRRLSARGGGALPLENDLDIPTLAESELPEDVDELALELLDADDLVRRRDE